MVGAIAPTFAKMAVQDLHVAMIGPDAVPGGVLSIWPATPGNGPWTRRASQTEPMAASIQKAPKHPAWKPNAVFSRRTGTVPWGFAAANLLRNKTAHSPSATLSSGKPHTTFRSLGKTCRIAHCFHARSRDRHYKGGPIAHWRDF